MATPLVAGSLALIRQYFTEGWYPAGVPNMTRAIVPSGPLMKAVLLGALSLLLINVLHPLLNAALFGDSLPAKRIFRASPVSILLLLI